MIQFHHFSEIASTHTFVEKSFAAFDPGRLTSVSADFQTAGRGTGSRSWLAPKSGHSVLQTFYFTLPERCKPQAASFLQVAALSFLRCLEQKVCKGLEGGEKLQFRLKWPNDLMLNGRKIGGILSRMVADPVRHAAKSDLISDEARLYQSRLFDSSSDLLVQRTTGFSDIHQLSPIYGSGSGGQTTSSQLMENYAAGGLTAGAACCGGRDKPTSAGGGGREAARTAGPPPPVLGSPPPPPTSYTMKPTNNFQHERDDAEVELEGPPGRRGMIGMIVSVGVNVNLTPADLQQMASVDNKKQVFVWPATSLVAEVGNGLLRFDAEKIRGLLADDLFQAIAD
eukprot:g20427.t1